MSNLIKFLVIRKYELKNRLPRNLWTFIYKFSLKKVVDQKVYGERRKIKKINEITFYIIRRRPPGAGLFSNVFHVLQGIINARNLVINVNTAESQDLKEKSFKKLESNCAGSIVPIVDFQNYYMSQLHLKGEFPNNINSWEIYFEQLSEYNLDDVYKNHSYILCDAQYKNHENFLLQKAPLWVHNKSELIEVSQIINKYIRPSKKLEELINNWKTVINWDPKTTLAVGIRGGNYEKYQYSGHAKQATMVQIAPEIELFIEKYPIDMIYPQTHNYDNYDYLKKRFGKMVQRPLSMERYNSKSEFLSLGPQDNPKHWDRVPKLSFDNNARYMVDIYLMAEACYLISPLSNGVAFAFAKNLKNLVDYKIMNLGVYA